MTKSQPFFTTPIPSTERRLSVVINDNDFGNTLTGSFNDDEIFGNGGDDTIYGQAGNDDIDGGMGNDDIYGGTGDDDTSGGEGDDVYYLTRGDGSTSQAGETILENFNEGIDTIRFTDLLPEEVHVVVSGGRYYLGLLDNGTFEWFFPFLLSFDEFFSRYERVEFDDGTVWTALTGLTHYGTDQGESQISTNIGEDMFGAGGDDFMLGRGGDDVLDGGTGADDMQGGTGDDTYIIRVGDGSTNKSAEDIVERIGEGTDTLRFVGIQKEQLIITSNGVQFFFGIDSGTLDGMLWSNPNTQTLDEFWNLFERIEFDDGTVWDATTGLTIYGTDEDESFFGTSSGDTFFGSLGDDEMHGGQGDDLYIIRAADGSLNLVADEINERDGNGGGIDTIRMIDRDSTDVHMTFSGGTFFIGMFDAGVLRYTTLVGSGITSFSRYERFEFADGVVWDATTGFTHYGTQFDDFQGTTVLGEEMYGYAGDDVQIGSSGNDLLDGGTGSDRMEGGGGDDIYILRKGDGSAAGTSNPDTIIEDTLNGNDTLRLIGITEGDLRVTKSGNYFFFHIMDDFGQEFTSRVEVTGGSDFFGRIETIEFGDGTIWDASTGLTFTGTDANDIMTGTLFDDTIFGADGTDTLDGSNGDDVLIDGKGYDRMSGGAGEDTFRFIDANSGGQIRDFDFDDDQIDLTPLIGLESAVLLSWETAKGTDTLMLRNDRRTFDEPLVTIHMTEDGSNLDLTITTRGAGDNTIFDSFDITLFNYGSNPMLTADQFVL
ncbi:calcium-binding protein [Shimia ponticola]|uniref:calcium-binding protein n=1 Tax=Shimia ponticola TaxID=2582893 RepID=UPI0011BD68C8|nr:hypothetical protein [Shimia ponticola]